MRSGIVLLIGFTALHLAQPAQAVTYCFKVQSPYEIDNAQFQGEFEFMIMNAAHDMVPATLVYDYPEFFPQNISSELPLFVRWRKLKPSEYTLWPQVREFNRQDDSTNLFSYRRIYDIQTLQKYAIGMLIKEDKLEAADGKLKGLLELLDDQNEWDDATRAKIPYLKYVQLRTACDAALGERQKQRFSNLERSNIEIENGWRRAMLDVADSMGEPKVASHTLFLCADEWMTFARQTMLREQKTWPQTAWQDLTTTHAQESLTSSEDFRPMIEEGLNALWSVLRQEEHLAEARSLIADKGSSLAKNRDLAGAAANFEQIVATQDVRTVNLGLLFSLLDALKTMANPDIPDEIKRLGG